MSMADFSHLAKKQDDPDSGNGCGCILLVFLIGGLLGWLNRN
jgi:hypothetical protein